jgi:hypothetical protein
MVLPVYREQRRTAPSALCWISGSELTSKRCGPCRVRMITVEVSTLLYFTVESKGFTHSEYYLLLFSQKKYKHSYLSGNFIHTSVTSNFQWGVYFEKILPLVWLQNKGAAKITRKCCGKLTLKATLNGCNPKITVHGRYCIHNHVLQKLRMKFML